jgi:hypothetical protein
MAFLSTFSPDSRPDREGRRTGATWVAATGAVLLLAAACVFVAANWDHIPDAVKLAALGGCTGAAVVAGDRLRTSLPATGNALFHLGTLLVPVNVAALDVRLGATWREMLLHASVVSVPTFALLASRARSVVLGAATSAAVVALAGGIAAVTPAPAPLLLAGAAAVLVARRRKPVHALWWAGLAGLAPVVCVAFGAQVLGHGVAEELGLLVVRPWVWPLVTGVVAAGAIAVEARRRDDVTLLPLAAAALVAHGAVAWAAADLSRAGTVLAGPALFLLVQVAALAVARDRFWARPAAWVAVSSDVVVAVPAAALGAGAAWLAPDATTAIACALLAVGWAAGVARRSATASGSNAGVLPGVLAAATALGALGAATGSATAVASGAVALAVATSAAAPRRWYPAGWGMAVYGSFVVAATTANPVVALTVPLVGALAAAAVVWRHGRDGTFAPNEALGAVAVAIACLGLGAGAASGTEGLTGALVAEPWVIAWWVAGCAGVVALVDRNARSSAEVVRVAALGSLVFILDVVPRDMVVPATALLVAGIVDTVRTRRFDLAVVLAAPAVQIQYAAAARLDLATGTTGAVLVSAAAVWLGLAALAPAAWRRPLAATGALSAVTGVAAASVDAMAFGASLTIVGALLTGVALVTDRHRLLLAAAASATVGVWVQLGAGGVQVSEPYVVPVAASLVAIGAWLRTTRPVERRPGSWAAYGPAVALLGASGVLERVRGGSSAHALFAGGVALLAIVVGASRRLSAPLLLGTATLAAVAGHEVLGTAAGIPLSAWLATAGVVLLGAAVAIERTDTSPVEAGRRVVDVLAEHFE